MNKMPLGLLMIATLLFHFVAVSPCPPNCICDKENTDCSGISLTAVPADVDTNTRFINISFNNISILKNKDLVDLKQLEFVLLNNNDISQLEPYVFHQTKKLLHLNLNNNKIVEMNLNLLKSLNQLRYLYLQKNNIGYIDPKLFVYNPHLVILDISGNSIHKLEPNTFQNNPILSWVNISGNPLTLPIEWKTLLSGTFNVLDVEFCNSSNSFISSFQKVPSVNLIGENRTRVLSLDEFMSFQNAFGLDPNEITYLKMKQFYSLNRLSYESVNNLTIGEELNVMSMTGDDVLCYCRHHEFWFWCVEQPRTPCQEVVTRSEKYKILGCNIDISDTNSAQIHTKGNTPDVVKRSGLFGSHSRPVNWKTVRNTLISAAVPLCIIALVIGAYIMKRVKSARKHRGSSLVYSEVNT